MRLLAFIHAPPGRVRHGQEVVARSDQVLLFVPDEFAEALGDLNVFSIAVDDSGVYRLDVIPSTGDRTVNTI